MSHEAFKIQRRLIPPEYQEPAVLNQAAPVQNTYYFILPLTANCRVYEVAFNVEDTDETLQLRITKDGIVEYLAAFAATNSTEYYLIRSVSAIARTAGYWHQATLPAKSFVMEGRSVSIEIRKTTAAGVGNLTGIATYGVYTEADV